VTVAKQFFKYFIYLFFTESWSTSQEKSSNTRAQKCLVIIAHYRVGVS